MKKYMSPEAYKRKLERNRKWRNKHKILTPIDYEIPKSSVPCKERKTYSLFQILDILRKDVNHYLNSKHLSLWSKFDWNEFNKLKEL